MEKNFNNKFLFYNIVFTVLQIFLSAFILFFLYRLIINTVGLKQLGIWSLISTSITSLSILNYGFSGSLVKYVSKYAILGDRLKVKKLIETTSISVSIFSFFLSIIGYFIFLFIIKQSISDVYYYNIAYKILPICLTTFWFTIVSSIYQSVLEGLNLSYLKNIIHIINYVVIIGFSYLLMPNYGLMGLALSYLISSLFLLVSSSFLAIKHVPEISILRGKWSKETYKETLNYNTNYQLISVFAIFNEPVTKFVLAKYGGLEISGVYELANKLVLQVRGIIVNVNQTLVPMFSGFQEKDETKVSFYFKKSFNVVLIAATLFFSLFLFFSPLFSLWWFKSINQTFLNFTIILSLCWYINTICSTAYFANLGSGNLKWNTITQILQSSLNIVLSFLFAFLLPSNYIILGWVIALTVSSSLVLIKYKNWDFNSPEKIFSFKEVKFLIFVLILLLAGYIVIYEAIKLNNYLMGTVSVIVFLLLSLYNFSKQHIFNEIKSMIALRLKKPNFFVKNK